MKVVLLLLIGMTLVCRAEDDVPELLDQISVTVRAGNSEGSGIVKTRDGVCYILTAGHVVEDSRHTRQIIENGQTRTLTEFRDATIIKHFVKDGRPVGTSEVDAEIISYSSADHGEDVALLRCRMAFTEKTTQFYTDKKIPVAGTNLFHVGSLHGDIGSNSFTTGVLAKIGRLIGGKVFDQTTAPALPGSSGGGMFLTDGRYIGMLVRGGDATFNFIIPVRRLIEWSKKYHTEFVFDDSKPVEPEKIVLEKGEEADKEFSLTLVP